MGFIWRTAPPVIQLSRSYPCRRSSAASHGLLETTLTLMSRWRRQISAGALADQQPTNPQFPSPPQQPPIALSATDNPSSRPSWHHIRLVPHLDSRPSFVFDPIARDVRGGVGFLIIGRPSDLDSFTNKLDFESRVVSRAHAEIWAETGGKFFIRDTKSSSGTFLNHIRLSPANSESRPFELKDGDVIQLGVDYNGGTKDIYRCVRMKVELGGGWQAGLDALWCVPFSYLLRSIF